MVKKIEEEGQKFYQCEICKFIYEESEWAKKCQNWCKENNSCNLVITKHAVQP